MYTIYIEHAAEKDLNKIPSAQFDIIVSKIKELANNPHPAGNKKLKDSDKFWRIRIGDYRVIYEINTSEKVIKIFKVRHRKDAYR